MMLGNAFLTTITENATMFTAVQQSGIHEKNGPFRFIDYKIYRPNLTCLWLSNLMASWLEVEVLA